MCYLCSYYSRKVQLQKSEDKRTALVAGYEDKTKLNIELSSHINQIME